MLKQTQKKPRDTNEVSEFCQISVLFFVVHHWGIMEDLGVPWFSKVSEGGVIFRFLRWSIVDSGSNSLDSIEMQQTSENDGFLGCFFEGMEWETLRNEEKVEESASTDISCSCVRPSSRFKQYFNPWYIWYQYMSCLCKFLYMCCQLFMLSPDLTRNRSNELREKRMRMPTKRLRVQVLMEMRHVMACCFFLSFLSFFVAVGKLQ